MLDRYWSALLIMWMGNLEGDVQERLLNKKDFRQTERQARRVCAVTCGTSTRERENSKDVEVGTLG
jgi:hypothetical protein